MSAYHPATGTNRLSRWSWHTASPEETRLLAEKLGELLQPGDVVTLAGQLGCGKTVFAQGLARGLGVPADFYITSPSYTIVNQYPGRIPFYHLDLYRLSSPEEFSELGLEEILYGQGAVAIEWPERLGEQLPEKRLAVCLEFNGESGRHIIFQAFGASVEERLAELARARK